MDNHSYFADEPANKYVKELTPTDFDDTVTWKLKNGQCGAVLFYAPWCPHCKAVAPAWIKFGEKAAFMNIMAFNCEKYSPHLMKIKEDLPQLVTSFPTIIFYNQGHPDEQYRGDRSDGALLKAGMRFCQAKNKKA